MNSDFEDVFRSLEGVQSCIPSTAKVIFSEETMLLTIITKCLLILEDFVTFYNVSDLSQEKC